MKYILASASPRRRELLSLIVDDFVIDVPKGEELCPEGTAPFDRPQALACCKAEEVASRHGGDLIIAADTAVFLDGLMLGKPKDEHHAAQMLSALSGRTHTVITGCCLLLGDKKRAFSVRTSVSFYPLSDREIAEYIATGEPMDKAGAYGIQGRGAVLVKGIEGDYFNVVGLPVAELSRQLSLIKMQ